MNYEEARSYLDESNRYGGAQGLDRISHLLDYLGHPEQDLSFVHIAGTNGKGSILSYVSTTLSLAGYRTGRYISPTLYSYEERFQIDGKPITKERFVCLMEQIAEAVEQIENNGYIRPSAFELETVLSFLYFREEKCDLVVLECGLGGAEDATNVIQNTVAAVFASISMDHMQYLGDTLGKIARSKSGIIKKGTPVVTSLQKSEAMEVLLQACSDKGSELIRADYHSARVLSSSLQEQIFLYEGNLWTIHMGGIYQIENAVTAIEVLKLLNRNGYPITTKQMMDGMDAARWNGRFTILSKEPVFLVDGAHNPDAARKFVKSLLNSFTGRRIIYIIGIFRDKAYDEIVRITIPYGSEIITIQTPDNPRALPAEELAAVVRNYTEHVQTAESLEEAVELAFSKSKKDDVIAAFGSLSFIGELTEIVKKYQEERND